MVAPPLLLVVLELAPPELLPLLLEEELSSSPPHPAIGIAKAQRSGYEGEGAHGEDYAPLSGGVQ